ncbi:aminotransferase class III-fold pyridoxal phosphate-dependent enzyme [Saccharothrix violaceirubra]|uniref:Acetylornithine/succinyldiaminopimelate/putresci ne aminotransferase n=1 Tax=Saccharothrix violaceirubra TaxID=413306 RepID=A0A7W7WWF6_9PSEU|nr:aminotransferase class III-fold pyridoxal phosphate-dependent enzyme [Saccharothrix violaceirubra]MBB4966305.1 acetylornithine/succinyldiaminopimelate/putrescine aminotransferase [Saccharothrix violaceirubra]
MTAVQPMTAAHTDRELAEPTLRGWLGTVGLDVEYVRAEGNTIYRLAEDGSEVAVLDLAGGYGSLLLGHNHPTVVARAQELLAAGTPIHAQFSRHPYANDVANRLNRIIRRELGEDEAFATIFANTGAEAIEAAIKHAELERGFRARDLLAGIEANLATTVTSVAPSAYEKAGSVPEEGLAGLLTAIAAHNAAVAARPPVFVTLEGGFHGKLAGSVQLTHNADYRTPFSALAAQARFVPLDQPGAVKDMVDGERASVLDIVVEGGEVRVVEHDFPLIAAFVVEPIQGEGGIRVVSAELAAEIQEAAASVGAPVVVDEIQSGMGRSGAFLASTLIGLRGDYYTLAKSLGGGVAKASVLLVRESRYRPEFELVHSSTFAKDAFSCHIASTVLELLESEDGRAYRKAAELGERLTAVLEGVRADYPDVVVDVRGKGLMLGLEFAAQDTATSEAIRVNAPFLGYAIAGYLLQAHDIRTFPTASAVTTLRFEPSVLLTEEEIGRLDRALRGAAEILRTQPEHGFTA